MKCVVRFCPGECLSVCLGFRGGREFVPTWLFGTNKISFLSLWGVFGSKSLPHDPVCLPCLPHLVHMKKTSLWIELLLLLTHGWQLRSGFFLAD